MQGLGSKKKDPQSRMDRVSGDMPQLSNAMQLSIMNRVKSGELSIEEALHQAQQDRKQLLKRQAEEENEEQEAEEEEEQVQQTSQYNFSVHKHGRYRWQKRILQMMQLVNQVIYGNIYSQPVEVSSETHPQSPTPSQSILEGPLLLHRGGLASFKWVKYEAQLHPGQLILLPLDAFQSSKVLHLSDGDTRVERSHSLDTFTLLTHKNEYQFRVPISSITTGSMAIVNERDAWVQAIDRLCKDWKRKSQCVVPEGSLVPACFPPADDDDERGADPGDEGAGGRDGRPWASEWYGYLNDRPVAKPRAGPVAKQGSRSRPTAPAETETEPADADPRPASPGLEATPATTTAGVHAGADPPAAPAASPLMASPACFTFPTTTTPSSTGPSPSSTSPPPIPTPRVLSTTTTPLPTAATALPASLPPLPARPPPPVPTSATTPSSPGPTPLPTSPPPSPAHTAHSPVSRPLPSPHSVPGGQAKAATPPLPVRIGHPPPPPPPPPPPQKVKRCAPRTKAFHWDLVASDKIEKSFWTHGGARKMDLETAPLYHQFAVLDSGKSGVMEPSHAQHIMLNAKIAHTFNIFLKSFPVQPTELKDKTVHRPRGRGRTL
ncbi:hypothetical protein CRUP_029228 [Coryphaenoides rupestris]|nr:hypothetical protein CRUP_029228 [Coryphaenoides rupestris]